MTLNGEPESHAQFAEDRILREIFGAQEHGYCAEVGAYDGRTGSATYAFEQMGWDCLLVEPVPTLAEKIRRRRNCIVVNCAASSCEGEATFLVAHSVEAMSTLDTSQAHRRWIERAGGHVEEITVPTRPLDDLLREVGFPRLHFITIDVEGHELEVLKGFSLDKAQPRVVIIEDNSLTPDNWPRRRSPVTAYMGERGYVHFKRTGVNEWYAHESDRELIRPEQLRKLARAKEIQLWRGRRKRLAHGVARRVGPYLPERTKRALRRLRESTPLVSGRSPDQ